MISRLYYLLFILVLFAAACSTPRVATVDENTEFTRSSMELDSIMAGVPNYSSSLMTIAGKGKAFVSEPGNNERVTINFSGNRQRSLVTIKNALGIEGGKILSEGDSLLIYNKVDNIAQKVPVTSGKVSSVQHLASVNIVQMMNYVPDFNQVRSVYESDDRYLLAMNNGAEVFIHKNTLNVVRVDQPRRSGLPYSRIVYEAYGTIGEFKLPRRVTIFSADARSKVALLIQSLEVNPGELDLRIDLPNDVKLVTQ